MCAFTLYIVHCTSQHLQTYISYVSNELSSPDFTSLSPSFPLPLPPPSSDRHLHSCCYSAARQPSTCSREGYFFITGLSCPAPPRIQFRETPGPFDDLTTYVSEHLLQVGAISPDAYENEYQLGFTIEDRPFFPREFCGNIANTNFLTPNITSSLMSSNFWTQQSALCLVADTNSRLAQHYIAALPGQQDPSPGVTVWYSNEVCVP